MEDDRPPWLDESPRGPSRRAVAALVFVASAVVLVATLLLWRTTSSPAAKADRDAQSALFSAWVRADRGEAVTTADPPIVVLPADVQSDGPRRLSIAGAGGHWFATSRSTTGRCFVIAAVLGSGRNQVGRLDPGAPCRGDAAKDVLDSALTTTPTRVR